MLSSMGVLRGETSLRLVVSIRDRNAYECLVHNEPAVENIRLMRERVGHDYGTNSTFQFIQRPRRHPRPRPVNGVGLSLVTGSGVAPAVDPGGAGGDLSADR